MTKLPRGTVLLIAALVLIVAMPAFAGDPPDRVMRLKYMSGQVSFQPGGVDDWVAAAINRPLTTADRVWTDKESRAELTLATASLRMDSETSMTVSNLSDNTVQVELDQGVLNVHVRKMYGGEIYEVDTPNVAFTLLKAGDYRFEVDAIADTTNVIVRHGKGEGNGNGRGVEVESGEMARFEHGNTLMHTMARASRPDGFDDWCRVRDKREDRVESARYVSDDVIGYEDLDEYGSWRPEPSYGYVWYPRTVAVGWAPYRYGHWAWIDPWGWTWVDDAPWGFAPFHYGRWVYSSYGWGWCPGPRHYRPIYAPAMVAWFGGSNWGVGLSFGGPAVGWVPLGWGEPYYPYYNVSRGYFRNVNVYNTHITNITIIENNYYRHGGHEFENVRYANRDHGFSAVNTGVLQHGRPVAREVGRVSDRDFKDGHFMRSADVAPTRAAVLGGRENVPAAIPPRGATNRPVVSKMTPPGRPEKFEDRAPFIERNRGMAVDNETMSKMRREGPASHATPGNGISVTPAEAGRPSNAEVNRRPVDVDRPNVDRSNNNRPVDAGVDRSKNSRPVDTNVDRSNNNRPVDSGNGRPENVTGRQVPRPPVRTPRVFTMEGNASENTGNVNRGPDRSTGPDRSVVPDRAPGSDRSVNVNDDANGRSNQHVVPRPPDRRPVSVDAQGDTPRNQGNGNAAPSSELRRGSQSPDATRVTAPQNGRSPIFDRNDSTDAGRKTDAEVSAPRNVTRPDNPTRPENAPVRNENRPPANVDRRPSQESVDRHAPPQQSQPAAERRSVPENPPARNVDRAPKEDRQVPRPSDSKPAKTDSNDRRSSLRPYPHPESYVARASSYSPRDSYSPRESYSPARSNSFSPRNDSYSARSESTSSQYARPANSRPSSSYSPSTSRSYSSPSSSRSYSSPSYSRPSASYSGTRSYSSRSYSGGSYAGGSSGSRSYTGGGSRSYGGGSGSASRGGGSSASSGSSVSHGSSGHRR